MTTRMKIILGVSLILNVFLVGIWIGVLVTGARIAPAAGPAQAQRKPLANIWMAAETLPPAERMKFRDMLRDKAAEVQPELKSVRIARREAAALMSQPNYDPKAVGEELQRAREGEMRARGELDKAFADYLTHLTPEQRIALAEAMVRSRPAAVRAAVNGQPAPGDAK